MKGSNRLLACAAALTLVLACSKNDSDREDVEAVLGESVPADSTGATGTMSANFSTSALSLTSLIEPTTREIGTAIELTYAKFNIAKIRIKAAADVSTEEKALETQEIEEEKVAVQEVEAETGDTEASLLKKTEKERADAKAAKIKEKKAKLDDVEKKKLRLEAARDKSNKFAGPYVYNAISGKLEGEVPAVSLVDGSYRRVDFQLKRNFDATEGEAILGNVFAIRGTVLKAGTKVPFSIDWHIAMNFRMVGDGALKVDAANDNALIVDFDLDKWFEGIDLAALTPDSDGTIYINKTTNQAVMKQLHRNIKIYSRFGKDANNDKILGETEKAGTGVETTDAEVE